MMLQQFVDEIGGLSDVSAVEDALGREVVRLGFQLFTYVILRAPGDRDTPFVITTYPAEWQQRYVSRDYPTFDPVLSRASRTLRAFDWISLRATPGLTVREKSVLDEARDFNVACGASVPIHAPDGGFAILSVATELGEQAFRELWRENWAALHILGLYVHSALLENLRCSGSVPDTKLTDRERECLLWTARGKTAWEVSEILGISNETVVFHLKNAMQKIGVYSKHHAVVKAILTGLIRP